MAIAKLTKDLYDDKLELADHYSTAVTSTKTDTGVSVPIRFAGNCKAMLQVYALDHTTGDETYTLTINVSDAVGGTYTTIATFVVPSTTTGGTYEIPLSGLLASTLDADCAYVQAVMTLAGTTPSIKYTVYLCPA